MLTAVQIIPSQAPRVPGEPLQALHTQFKIGDQDLHGVVAAQIFLAPDELVRAKLELFAEFVSFDGVEGEIIMQHPLTGQPATVKRIEFEDAEAFEC